MAIEDQLRNRAEGIESQIQNQASTIEDRVRAEITNALIPANTFAGSLDDARQRVDEVIQRYEEYKNSIPEVPEIPTVPSLIARFVPPIPSYGEIKAQLYNRLKQAKQERQEAAIEAANAVVEQSRDGFEYRKKMMERANSKKYIKVPPIRINNNS